MRFPREATTNVKLFFYLSVYVGKICI